LKPRAAAGEGLAAIYTSPWTTFHPIPSHRTRGRRCGGQQPDATNPPNPPRDIEQFTALSLHNINLSVACSLRQGPGPAPSRQRCRCLMSSRCKTLPPGSALAEAKSVAGSVAVVRIRSTCTCFLHGNLAQKIRTGAVGVHSVKRCGFARTARATILSYYRPVSLSSSLPVSTLQSLSSPTHPLSRHRLIVRGG